MQFQLVTMISKQHLNVAILLVDLLLLNYVSYRDSVVTIHEPILFKIFPVYFSAILFARA
jgi:hypothetical protein